MKLMFINRIYIASVIFLLVQFNGAHLFAQTGYPACVSVVSDGTISIKMTESFTGVFTSPAFNGPYTQVPASEMTIVGQTITFDDNVNLNGNEGVHWFYFDSPDFKDTIANILLLLELPSGTAIADLSWNLPFGQNPSFTGGLPEIVLQWDFPENSGWSDWKVFPYNTLGNVYKVDICSDSLNFRAQIRLQDNTGADCFFVSNSLGDNFENKIPPSSPELYTVSIDTAVGHAVIEWLIPPEPDVFGYVVAEPVGNANIPIEEIWDPEITTYTDVSTNPNNQFYNYSVAAFDSCPNPEGNFPNFISTFSVPSQHTILLNSTFDECDSALILEWNKYDNWPEGVNRYELWLSENGMTYKQVASLDSAIATYLYKPVNPNIDYCFLVKAIDGSGNRSSLSNIRCKFADFTSLPDSFYLSEVNTDFRDDNRVYLKLFVKGNPDVNMQGFKVEAKYPNREFKEIGFLPFVSGNSIYTFEDTRANEINDEIWYRVLEIDVCGKDRRYSNEINNVHLEITTDSQNAFNSLLWNKAQGRAGTIESYKLYRVQTSTGIIESVIFVADEYQNSFEDDLSEAYETDGNYCYVVQVIEKRDTVLISNEFSNMVCGLIDPRVWIPNAYIIEGSSPTFLPVFAYADLSAYSMKIYNRKGQLLFSSNNASIGWDGRYKNKPVQQGVYVYIIEFNDGNGKSFTEKGTVTVL